MEGAFRILVIADPQLKGEINRIVNSCTTQLTVHYWRKGDSKHLIENEWHCEHRWDLVFSIYSDYILPPNALNKIRIPINIHPALPNNPGVGYDVYPLIHNEGKCGATIHWMEEKSDHGVVLESKTMPLPHNATYSITRKLNQSAVLSLFEKWFRLASNTSKLAFYERLQVPLNQGRGWTGPYASQHTRNAKLLQFRANSPLKWDRFDIPMTLFSRVLPSSEQSLK